MTTAFDFDLVVYEVLLHLKSIVVAFVVPKVKSIGHLLMIINPLYKYQKIFIKSIESYF